MTTIKASDVTTDFDSVKSTLMGGISAGWIDGADPINIAEGVGNLFQKTYYGPQGWAAWDWNSGDDRGSWAWVSSLNKTANKGISSTTPVPYTDYAILTQEQFFDIHGLSKRVWVPATCLAQISITADINSPRISEWDVDGRLKGYYGGTASHAYLFVDGMKAANTLGLSFEEGIVVPLTGEIGVGFDPALTLNVPSVNWTKRYYSVSHTAYLTKGWHTFVVKVDPRAERSYVSRRGIFIDATYI